MSKVDELKEVITSLPEDEYIQPRQWFSERDGQKWDEQIYEDSATGKPVFLSREANEEKHKSTLEES